MLEKYLAYNPAQPLLLRLIIELIAFAYKNAVSCLFPVFIFGMLALSQYISVPFLYRYDLLLILCLAMQVVMYFTGLESFDEVKVITIFHLLGITMEIYKVNHGSWAYPEMAWTKVGGVPLYSGFMYASVASFICQAWKRLNLEVKHWPNPLVVWIIGFLIYANFFTKHYIYDIRWIIIAMLFIIFFRTQILFINNKPRRMLPFIISFFLVGLFIWFAENIATFLGAWKYPYQETGWQMVHFNKLSSWFLLVIVSFIIVTQLKIIKHVKYHLKTIPKPDTIATTL